MLRNGGDDGGGGGLGGGGGEGDDHFVTEIAEWTRQVAFATPQEKIVKTCFNPNT